MLSVQESEQEVTKVVPLLANRGKINQVYSVPLIFQRTPRCAKYYEWERTLSRFCLLCGHKLNEYFLFYQIKQRHERRVSVEAANGDDPEQLVKLCILIRAVGPICPFRQHKTTGKCPDCFSRLNCEVPLFGCPSDSPFLMGGLNKNL